MNHTYRLIWNHSSHSYVPAPETSKARGKSTSRAQLIPAAIAITLSASLALPAYAKMPIAQSMANNTLPQGGQVVAGQASINQAGQQMTINQGSQKAIINWNKFNIGQDASVTFQQPNSKAIALNRVITNDASQIHGQLNANGQVWLINPSGVLFGKNSQVNVGGMVASTLDIANKDFLKDNYQFKRDQATGGISNLGTLTAAAGGYIALLAPTVSNEGIITAQLGSVTLAAGDQITLNAGADGLLNVQLDPATVETLIENKQLIVADGGQVIMTGRAADALSASVVSNSGKVQANAIAEKDGRILLVADMQHGQTQAAGELSAKFVETSAAKVVLDKNLKVNTQGGEWLIDPVDIIIDSAKAQAIQTGLNSGNVTVTTADNANNPWGDNGAGSDAGDIHVNADITYTQNKLTLNADNNINLNAEINVNGSGTLALNPGGNINAKFGDNGGFAGKVNFAQSGPGLLTINSNNYTVINSLGLEGSTNGTDLQGMNGNLSGYYALGSNIDASATSGWDSNAGFLPIGNYSTKFTGSFDGLGHSISGLTINRPLNNYQGLFGVTTGASIRNIGLVNNSVNGKSFVGGLAGLNSSNSTISNISNSTASGSVNGTGDYVGGLVGQNFNNSSISNSTASGNISGAKYVGGLVGRNFFNSSIVNSTASGNVNGTGDYVGGLVGQNISSSSISNSTASGSVNGTGDYVGGLVGHNNDNGSISSSFASSSIIDAYNIYYVGGLVGQNSNDSTISNSFWDTETTKRNNGCGTGSDNCASAIGKTTAQMKSLATFSGWDIDDAGGTETIWRIYDGDSYPLLRALLTPYSITDTSISKTYDGNTYAVDHILYTGDAQGKINAGTYSIHLYSDQQGYDLIGDRNANLTINKATITVSTSNVTKIYDGTTSAIGTATLLSGTLGTGDSLSGGTFAFADKNAGIGNKTVEVAGITVDDGNSGDNYIITQQNNTSSTINRADISAVTGITANNKTYNGNTDADLVTTGAAFAGMVGGDNLTVATASGAFTDKNVGTSKTVNISDITLGGTDAGNYNLTNATASTTADITAASISAVTGITANSKTYNGNTDADLVTTGAVFTDMVGGDNLTVATATGAFTDKNVGTSKTVNISDITLGGTDADNYTLDIDTASTTANITAASLSVTDAVAADKVYDATTDASISDAILSGTVYSGDIVTLNNASSGTFDTKNVGTGKTVTTAATLSGTDAGNYQLTQQTGLTANISKAAASVTGMATNVTYNGVQQQAAAGTSGFIETDDISISGLASGTNAGTYGSSLTVGGSDAGNYNVSITNANLVIGKASATVTANSDTKTYNGQAQSVSGFTASGLVNGESVSVLTGVSTSGGSGTSAGTYAHTASGTDGNYELSFVDGALTIAPAPPVEPPTPPVEPPAPPVEPPTPPVEPPVPPVEPPTPPVEPPAPPVEPPAPPVEPPTPPVEPPAPPVEPPAPPVEPPAPPVEPPAPPIEPPAPPVEPPASPVEPPSAGDIYRDRTQSSNNPTDMDQTHDSSRLMANPTPSLQPAGEQGGFPGMGTPLLTLTPDYVAIAPGAEETAIVFGDPPAANTAVEDASAEAGVAEE